MRQSWKIGLIAGVLMQLSRQTAFAAAVATSSPYATQAAQQILKDGGNAFDAACGAMFVLGVAQPYLTGLGGGGLALIDTGKQPKFFDFRESSYANTGKNWFKTNKKNPSVPNDRSMGPRSVGIPGNVAGCAAIHAQYGSLPWKRILAPAIELAKTGFPLSQLFQEEISEQWNRIEQNKETLQTFGGSSGKGMKKGEILIQPVLARTLTKIAEAGYDEFKSGSLARAWTSEARAAGVPITVNDLKTYTVEDRPLASTTLGPYKIVVPSAPSGAGFTVASPIRFLWNFSKKYPEIQKSRALQLIAEIEALNFFLPMRDRFIADPKTTRLQPENFWNSSSEKEAWSRLEKRILVRSQKAGITLSKNTASAAKDSTSQRQVSSSKSHTSHLSVVDDLGRAVALTSSLDNYFGSSIQLPNFGFILNSTLSNFSDAPNDINAVGPKRRPRTNMSPTFLYEKASDGKDHLVAIAGAAGGPLIPQVVLQFLANQFLWKMTPKESIEFGRFNTSGGLEIEFENSLPEDIRVTLKLAGYEPRFSETIWAVMDGVSRTSPSEPWIAVADPRYDGQGWTNQVAPSEH